MRLKNEIRHIMTTKMNMMSSHFQPDQSLNLAILRIQLFKMYMKIELSQGNKKKTKIKENRTLTSLLKNVRTVEIDLIRMVLS